VECRKIRRRPLLWLEPILWSKRVRLWIDMELASSITSGPSLKEMHMRHESDKVKLVAQLPDPPEMTESVRSNLLSQSKEWRASFSEKVAEMEAITADDLRARAR
jgi:hypothetical protein